MEAFYSDLPDHKLVERKTYHLKVFLSFCFVWILSWCIMVSVAEMDVPLALLYSAAILGTIVSLWADYKNKIKLINKILKSR